MKQKKSPVLLIVGTLTVVGLLALVNATGLLTNGLAIAPDVQKPKDEDMPKPRLVTTREVNANKNALKSALEKKNVGTGTEEENQTVSKIPTRPTILLPEFKRHEPQENETATSSQWFNEESRMKAKADDLTKKNNGQ